MESDLRLDHYLFRARLAKSRSQATSACKDGKVQVNGKTAKPADSVRANDEIKIRHKGQYRVIRVLELPGKNMAKQDAKETWRDETPEETVRQWELASLAMKSRPHRDAPRPTKKERRDLRKLRGH